MPVFVYRGSDGATPEAAMVLGSDGNYYGTASAAGDFLSSSLIFRLWAEMRPRAETAWGRRMLEYVPRKELCDTCQGKGASQLPTIRIYMSFFVRGAGTWIWGFLEQDLKMTVTRSRCFGSEEKVRELIDRTPTTFDLAGRQALDAAFRMGRGGIYLSLTGDQYRKLKE